ncbi:thiolase (plasmid) [Antarctobacter heliothermus]|uniref:Thiolase n=1 Tax=Antarctobacter heliothermus TaxID=74033 RepID=A0A222EBW8_9RHOB|nr:acetyl-CoA acetyltransferase [Antarctobacter heliothermus]ASP23481.1 thiolase [Antarctobacter heliothermus]
MNDARQAAVVGVAESDDIGIVPDKSTLQLQGEASLNALTDAGLTLKDVDGLFTAGFRTTEVAEYLGIQPRYFDGTHVGGSSFVVHLGHAAAAIASGRIEVALIVHGESGRSGIGLPASGSSPQGMEGQFEHPYGMPGAPGAYAMACARHMHQYGTTHEQLAEIAVAARKWAQLNERAFKRDPLSIDDVMASPIISWPFRKLDCCLVTDAAGAVVLTSTQRAKDLDARAVRVIGWGEGHDHQIISQMPDLTSGPGRISGPDAFAMAGVAHDDIDVAQIYDSFTYTVLTTLEDIGFCNKGEGGDFVSGGRIAPGGDLALNTSGGGLSYTHPGMFGIFTIIECVRQLRGSFSSQGQRQIENAKIGLVHGTGGKLSATGTAILAVE